MNERYSLGFKDVCKECANAKDHRGGGHYCTQYGIIIGYPKLWCVGFKEKTNETEGKDNANKD